MWSASATRNVRRTRTTPCRRGRTRPSASWTPLRADGNGRLLSPLVRRLAAEAGLDPAAITGTGAGIYLLNVLPALAYGWSVAHWALPARIAVVSVPVTALMTWLVMPRAARLLQNWLYAPERRI